MTTAADSLWHVTVLTGHTRQRPRHEVAEHVIEGLRLILSAGGGALGNTGWSVLVINRSKDDAVFNLSHRGVEVARCWLALTKNAEKRLWQEASRFPTLPGRAPRPPVSTPWLAAGLLPDGLLLQGDPQLMLELGDLECCVAWALITETTT